MITIYKLVCGERERETAKYAFVSVLPDPCQHTRVSVWIFRSFYFFKVRIRCNISKMYRRLSVPVLESKTKPAVLYPRLFNSSEAIVYARNPAKPRLCQVLCIKKRARVFNN